MAHPLFPYQEVGASFLAQRDRAGLHDEMGIGKTAQFIRAINLCGHRRGLVAGPASLRANFIREYRKFGQYDLRICKGHTVHDYVAWQRGRYDIMVTSYELGTKWYQHWRTHGEFLDFSVIDEAHYLKEMKTARTRAFMGVDACMSDCWAQWSCQAWHVTGTPIPNDPVDIYTFLRFVGAMPLSLPDFIKRYFVTRRTTYGMRCTVRPEMAPELQALIENNRIRRTQAEIGIQLPPIFLTTALVDGDDSRILDLLREHPGLDAAILAALERGQMLPPQKDTPVATLRRLIGEAKAVPYAHQLLEELRFTGDKRVVFGIHINALEYVRDFLVRNGIHAVLVRGGTKDPDAEVQEFQNNPACQCIVGNIKALGTGHTLTAACEIDMLESDFAPAGNAQAIKRIARIGQVRKMRARFITLANSFDETVNGIVAEKTAAIAAVEGDEMIAAPPLLT